MRISLSILAIVAIGSLCALKTTNCREPADARHQQALTTAEIPAAFNFGDYVAKFQKDYNLLEASSKARLFFARTLQIFKHNVQFMAKKAGYYLNQNQFTDMTVEEAKRALATHESELKPVQEAALAPEMPADDYYEQSKNGDDHLDGISRGASPSAPRPARSSGVDFFRDSSAHGDALTEMPANIEPGELLRDLRLNKDLANEMSRFIEMKNSKRPELMETKLEKIREARKIVKQVQPIGANKNFDSSLIPSKVGSWGQRQELFSRTYADLIMNDFSEYLDPYPEPEPVPKGPTLPSPSTRSPVSARGLLKFVSDVYGVFKAGAQEVVGSDDEDDDELEADARKVAHSELINGDSVTVAAAPQAVSVQAPGAQAMNNGGQAHFHQLALLKRGPVRYDIDWRRTGCVPRPKSQQKCNACYVFAALDVMEFFYCQQTKGLIEFSAQYVIDCGHKAQLNGCQGGKLSNVGIFIKQFGIQTSAMYPYAGVQQRCPFEPAADSGLKSYQLKPTITRWKLHSAINAWYEWLPKTPIIVGINMPSDFLAYGGGIHDGDECLPDMVHAMVLVGSGIQDGKTFWLLRNTFSYTWGEGGYFRLAKRAPLNCFNSAIVAKARF